MAPTQPSAGSKPAATQNGDRVLKVLATVALVCVSLALLKFIRTDSIDARLYRAALAAAQEATLPHASRTSVVQAVHRSLVQDNCGGLSPDMQLLINSRPATRSIDCRRGDRVSVTLTAELYGFGPSVLRAVGLGLSNSPFAVSATLEKP